MQVEKRAMNMRVKARAGAQDGQRYGKVLKTHWRMECRDAQGGLKWVDEFDNLVVTAGLNDSLTQHFKASNYTAAWYIGLTGYSPTFAAGDTLASHAGWTETTAYDEATRPALTLGAVANGSVDNSASQARFTVSANGTQIGGAFLANNNTKGGTTGTLYGGGALGNGNRLLADNDTLDILVTLAAAAG